MAIRTKNADGDTEKRRMPMTFAATEKGEANDLETFQTIPGVAQKTRNQEDMQSE